MKRYFALSSLTFALASPSFADEESFLANTYAGANVGFDILSDNEDQNGDDVGFDTGYALSLQLGTRYRGLRTELEFNVDQADVSTSQGGDLLLISGGLGAYVDLYDYHDYRHSLAIPYAGLGVALGNAKLDGDDDIALTGHVEAGLAFPLGEQIDLGVVYRFRWLDTDAGGLSDDLLIHQARLGIRYYWNE